MKNQIVLMDGKSEISSWPMEAAERPTVGDRIDISAAATNSGYGKMANVTKVEMDQNHGTCRIEVEAECPLATDQRPVVTLNASMVREDLRKSVEELVRSRLDFPVLEWEQSHETKAIVRVHEFKGTLRTPLDKLQSDIRQIVLDASELAVI